jgi:hypothetical protein
MLLWRERPHKNLPLGEERPTIRSIFWFLPTNGMDLQRQGQISDGEQALTGQQEQLRRLEGDGIEGVCLPYLREVGNDSCLSSILKIHGEN